MASVVGDALCIAGLERSRGRECENRGWKLLHGVTAYDDWVLHIISNILIGLQVAIQALLGPACK